MGNCYGQNLRELRSWEHAIDARRIPLWRGLTLSEDDLVRANVIEQLMCHGSIDVQAIELRHGIEFGAYFKDALYRLMPMLADGLIALNDRAITVTAPGHMLLRSVAMCFDRYATPSGSSPEHASRPA
jgi:oxygen-independent coproporphyrinogen III oxidase